MFRIESGSCGMLSSIQEDFKDGMINNCRNRPCTVTGILGSRGKLVREVRILEGVSVAAVDPGI